MVSKNISGLNIRIECLQFHLIGETPVWTHPMDSMNQVNRTIEFEVQIFEEEEEKKTIWILLLSKHFWLQISAFYSFMFIYASAHNEGKKLTTTTLKKIAKKNCLKQLHDTDANSIDPVINIRAW